MSRTEGQQPFKKNLDIIILAKKKTSERAYYLLFSISSVRTKISHVLQKSTKYPARVDIDVYGALMNCTIPRQL